MQTVASFLPPQGVTVVTGVMAVTGPSSRVILPRTESRAGGIVTLPVTEDAVGVAAAKCRGGEDAADGVGPQTEDRRQPAAEAQWGCVLACAENTARTEHRKPAAAGADRGTGSGAADGEGCVGPGGAGVTVVAGTAWRR